MLRGKSKKWGLPARTRNWNYSERDRARKKTKDSCFPNVITSLFFRVDCSVHLNCFPPKALILPQNGFDIYWVFFCVTLVTMGFFTPISLAFCFCPKRLTNGLGSYALSGRQGGGTNMSGGMTTQQTRMRQFCVEIAPPFIRRNIDAALLREHSVRRICAHYKGLQICANSTHALTYASNLRKKITN